MKLFCHSLIEYTTPTFIIINHNLSFMTNFCCLNQFFLLDINLNNPFVKVLLPLIGIVVVLLVCKKRLHYSLQSDLLLKKTRLQQLLLWIAIDMAWMTGTNYFISWRGPWDFTSWAAQPLYVSILRVVGVCFLGPVLEELIFRGMLFQKLVRTNRINEWTAVIVLAAIWACLHYTYSIAVIAVIFVEGMLLGAALIKSRSLIVPIVMHICWNLYAIW